MSDNQPNQARIPFMCYLPSGLTQEQIDSIHSFALQQRPQQTAESTQAESQGPENPTPIMPKTEPVSVEDAIACSTSQEIDLVSTSPNSAREDDQMSVTSEAAQGTPNIAIKCESPMDEPTEVEPEPLANQPTGFESARLILKPKPSTSTDAEQQEPESSQRRTTDQPPAENIQQREEQPIVAQQPTCPDETSLISDQTAEESAVQSSRLSILRSAVEAPTDPPNYTILFGFEDQPKFRGLIPPRSGLKKPEGPMLLEKSDCWTYFCAENAEYILRDRDATMSGLVQNIAASFNNVVAVSKHNLPNGDITPVKAKHDELTYGRAHVILVAEYGLSRIKTMFGKPLPVEAARRINYGVRQSTSFAGLRERFTKTMRAYQEPNAMEFFAALANLVAVQMPTILCCYKHPEKPVTKPNDSIFPVRPIIVEAKILEEYGLCSVRDNMDIYRAAKLTWIFGEAQIQMPFPRYMAEIPHSNYDAPMETWSFVDQRTVSLIKITRQEIRAFIANSPSPYHLSSALI